MKKSVKFFGIVMFILSVNFLSAQTLDDYMRIKGCATISKAAHTTNVPLSGTYDVEGGYVDVSIKSRDKFFGALITTNIRVIRGAGDLYFSDLIVQYDNDMVNPFEAFGLQAELFKEILRAIDPNTFNKMRQAIMDNFGGTDIDHWTGKMWALLALNLDYCSYALGNR